MKARALTAKALPEHRNHIRVPEYNREEVTVGIAHFGVGNFHRAHMALYVEKCLEIPGNEDWGIVGIGISDGERSREKARQFAKQDGLYSLTEFSSDGSKSARVVGAMLDYMHAPTDPEAVIARLADPSIRIVSLTITEGGYFVDETTGEFQVDNAVIAEDIAAEKPSTVFGFIVRALQRRQRAGIAPFTVISCDNLRGNGDVTRTAVLGYAEKYDSALSEWIAQHGAFPNSMVDRITPYVNEQDRASLNENTGIDDELPVMAEDYLQWVIEDDFASGRPDFDKVGVELRSDVSTFETVKGRLLNASHVLLSYPALLAGYRVVAEAMADTDLRKLLHDYMTEDAFPLLDVPQGLSLPNYRDQILDRFSNPAIKDQLIRIATDGASKIPVFHSQTTRGLLTQGRDMTRIAFLFACYRRYLDGVDDEGNDFGAVEPSLSDSEYDALKTADKLAVLRFPTFAHLNLANNAEFADKFLTLYESICSEGTLATLRNL